MCSFIVCCDQDQQISSPHLNPGLDYLVVFMPANENILIREMCEE